SIESILDEFILRMKHTFGSVCTYIGTTSDTKISTRLIRDIDIIVVFSQLNEGQVNYVWKIINELHMKYRIICDVRLYQFDHLPTLPTINKYLLKIFLNNLLGNNPFKDFSVADKSLKKECLKRIEEQQAKIIEILPRVVGSAEKIRSIGQSVYDAIRAFLIIEGKPVAGKEQACSLFCNDYLEFSEVGSIYKGYLNPDEIVNLDSFIIDSIALVKHLYYRALQKSLIKEVLLVNTPASVLPHPRDEYIQYDNNMPLGLVCLASYLSSNNIKVKLLDSYAENLGVLSTIDKMFSNDSVPKIIGLNASSPNIHIAQNLAAYIKRINKEIIVVCGGPHASMAPKHTLSTNHIDYAIIGEGEIPFKELIETILLQDDKPYGTNIDGVIYLTSNRIVGNQEHESIDLAKIPTPNFSYLPLYRYYSSKKRIYIHTSRGCAFRCIYCSVPKCWGNKVRTIPMKLIIEQLEQILTEYEPEEIQIVDDNFSHQKGKYIKEFCNWVIEKNMDIKWKCQVRADQLDKEVIRLMADSGCFEIDIGVESGNKDIQKYIRKNINLEKTLETVSQISNHSIYSKAFIMLGFPEEKYEQISDTINYTIKMKNNGLNDLAVFPVMPFPGTEIAELTGKIVFQGAIIDNVNIFDRSFAAQKLRKYSSKPEFSLNNRFSPDELRFLVKFAYQRFELGVDVNNLEKEFKEFVNREELELYGI
ncbi:MAG: B12-binding domain-containing radical SAM protein, partial [candidate division Zixibacteria bacterium]|nr:B12-binding domain-containing radical SAM protein [candidate division Zixibacteria bacterium]